MNSVYGFGGWELRWLGHDGFQLLNDKTTLYIDLFQTQGGRPADYICISHDHYDHFDPASLKPIQQINTVIIGPQSVTDQLNEMAIPLLAGESHQAKELTVQAVAAYNVDKQFHPKANQGIGFILELDGFRLYHAGDTDCIAEMEQLGPIDLALLPVSGTYTMTADEAVQAVATIKPKVAIPMHYGAIIGSRADADIFTEKAAELTEVIILDKTNPI